MAKLICYECGKELPTDSVFCQYCGSKNIGKEIEKTILPVNNNADEMICLDCNKSLPADSVFCQYCGSKNITTIKKEESKTDTNVTYDSKRKASTDDIKKIKSYKTPLIIVCVIGCFLAIGWISTYSNQLTIQTQMQEEIDELNNKVTKAESKAKTAETKATNYKTKATKYDSVSSALANQKKYNDFYVSTQFVKGTSNTITVYAYENGSYTVWAQGSGSADCEWQGEFTGSGTQTAKLKITCSSSSYGTITLTNSWNSEKIVIFVTGS